MKDVIQQCLTETHRLHIGAPTEDGQANGEPIQGSGEMVARYIEQHDSRYGGH